MRFVSFRFVLVRFCSWKYGSYTQLCAISAILRFRTFDLNCILWVHFDYFEFDVIFATICCRLVLLASKCCCVSVAITGLVSVSVSGRSRTLRRCCHPRFRVLLLLFLLLLFLLLLLLLLVVLHMQRGATGWLQGCAAAYDFGRSSAIGITSRRQNSWKCVSASVAVAVASLVVVIVASVDFPHCGTQPPHLCNHHHLHCHTSCEWKVALIIDFSAPHM